MIYPDISSQIIAKGITQGSRPKRPQGFSLLEVIVASVILSMLGLGMLNLSDLSRRNFRATQNYLDANNILNAEIAFAIQSAQQYTWCDALYGGFFSTLTFTRNTIASTDTTRYRFCGDNFYQENPVLVYNPPYVLTLPKESPSRCYSYANNDTSTPPVAIGTFNSGNASLFQQDSCTRYAAYPNTATHPNYSPWLLFRNICHTTFYGYPRTNTGNNNESNNGRNPLVGNLVSQLVGHAGLQGLITTSYNNSSVEQNQTNRILLFYTINYSLSGSGVTAGTTQAAACAGGSGCRSITRAVIIDPPVAKWCL